MLWNYLQIKCQITAIVIADDKYNYFHITNLIIIISVGILHYIETFKIIKDKDLLYCIIHYNII